MTESNKKTSESSLKTLWLRCIEDLELRIDEENINTWIRPLQLQLRKNSLFLLTPNSYAHDWVEKNALKKIKSFFQEKLEDGWQIFLQVGGVNEKGIKVKKKSDEKESFFLPPIRKFNPAYSFDNFIEGKSNQFALALAKRIAGMKSIGDAKGKSKNLLFLYGGVGLGKTHLLNAIGNRMIEMKQSAKVVYIQSENFVSGMVYAIKNGCISEFKNYYRSLDAILVDDIQLFMKKTQTQEEFFHTFNSLFEKQNRIVLTCDRYPKKLTGVEERLRSRFSCGVVQEIDPPEIETRVAILEKKSEESGITLSEDIAFFIASIARSNVRELEGCLANVFALTQFYEKDAVTLDIAKLAMAKLVAANATINSVENIQTTVANYYNIRVLDMLSPKRNRAVVRARQVAISLAKEITNFSLSRIGDSFGGRDHATVLHSLRKIKELKKTDPQLQEEYKRLQVMLGN